MPVFGKQRKMDDYAYIEDTEKCIAALKTKFMELREKVSSLFKKLQTTDSFLSLLLPFARSNSYF